MDALPSLSPFMARGHLLTVPDIWSTSPHCPLQPASALTVSSGLWTPPLMSLDASWTPPVTVSPTARHGMLLISLTPVDAPPHCPLMACGRSPHSPPHALWTPFLTVPGCPWDALPLLSHHTPWTPSPHLLTPLWTPSPHCPITPP